MAAVGAILRLVEPAVRTERRHGSHTAGDGSAWSVVRWERLLSEERCWLKGVVEEAKPEQTCRGVGGARRRRGGGF